MTQLQIVNESLNKDRDAIITKLQSVYGVTKLLIKFHYATGNPISSVIVVRSKTESRLYLCYGHRLNDRSEFELVKTISI